MIPAVIAPDTRSPGEHELFKRLRDDPATGDWIVLHSFDLPRHVTQVRGEADFVILAPGLGMLCLEVKAHRRVTRASDGRWRFGNDPPRSRGPFTQAHDNMQSLVAVLRERRRAEADAVVAWSAVAFTHAEFREPAVEWNDWEVIDSRDLRRHPVSELVGRVLRHAREALPFKALPGVPTVKECESIASALRPRFEVIQPAAQRRAEAADELRAYTEEQYAALDGLARYPRALFEGPAGTGKTLLALEAARREAASGRRVALLCFNRLLGTWLEAEATAMVGAVTASTLHRLMIRTVGTQAPDGAGSAFFQDALPDAALAALLDTEAAPPFDVLVIDEAQDILRAPYLDFLDVALKGGLAAGRWTMFGDFERQALYDAANVSLDDFTAQRPGAPVFGLRTNCRNTPRVARWISMLAQLEPAYGRIRRPDTGPAPRTRYYASHVEQTDLLAATLEELYAAGLDGRDIVVLSPRRDGAVTRLGAPWRDRLRPYSVTERDNYVRHATIHAFKGLEAPAVILTDIDELRGERARALFYAGTSRATDRLCVLADTALRAEMLDLFDRFEMENA